MSTITIRTMSKKELAGICECSVYHLGKTLDSISKKNKQFGKYKGHSKLTRTQVEIVLIETDIAPKEIQIQ